VWASLIEVVLVLPYDPAEVALIEDKEKVEAFAPYAAQESLAYGIGLGSLKGSGQDFDTGPLSDPVKGMAELVVVVANQESWSLAKRSCLPQLLGDPGVVGTSGYAEMEQSPRLQFNDDKDKNGAEKQVIGLQEVNSPDVLGMVAKERGPRLLGRKGRAHLVDVSLNRALGHLDAQLEKFSSYAFRAPGAIIIGHGFDEGHDILGQRLSAFPPLTFGLASPEQAKEISMPAQ
jgi:hypothetical protein